MAIKNILILQLAIFPILLQTDLTYTIGIPLEDPLEYKVNIGDSHIYKYTEFYDSRLLDPSKDLQYTRDIYGEFRNYTIEKGIEFQIRITDVTETYVSGTRAINGVTIEEDSINLFVRPMTTNMSLLAESFSESDSFEVYPHYIIEKVTETSFSADRVYYSYLNRSRTSIWERPGWTSYLLIRVYDAETIYYEMEVEKQAVQSEQTNSNEQVGILMLTLILFILALQFLLKRK